MCSTRAVALVLVRHRHHDLERAPLRVEFGPKVITAEPSRDSKPNPQIKSQLVQVANDFDRHRLRRGSLSGGGLGQEWRCRRI